MMLPRISAIGGVILPKRALRQSPILVASWSLIVLLLLLTLMLMPAIPALPAADSAPWRINFSAITLPRQRVIDTRILMRRVV